jgi:hypothetical protein
MKRLTNVRKKSDVNRRMLQITAVKGSGVGQAFSDINSPSNHGAGQPISLQTIVKNEVDNNLQFRTEEFFKAFY